MAIKRAKDGSNIENYTSVMTGFSFAKGTLLNATPVIVNMVFCPLPCTVAVKPNAGDSIRVEYSLDEATTWRTWPAGDATDYTEVKMAGSVTDMKFTRITGSSSLSTWVIS